MMLLLSPCKRCPCPCSDAVLRSCAEALAGIILHRPPSRWFAWVRSGCAGPLGEGAAREAEAGGGGGGWGPGTREHIYIYTHTYIDMYMFTGAYNIYTYTTLCVCVFWYMHTPIHKPRNDCKYVRFHKTVNMTFTVFPAPICAKIKVWVHLHSLRK